MAKNSHAPDCNIVIENGTVRSYIFALPRATDSLQVHYQADQLTGLSYVNFLGQAGHINIGFMGGGQVDRYGNVNDTAIGDYYNPVHRWPGSGGGNDVMSFCKATTIILRQSKQRFPEHVDFNTCPGYLNGKPGEREAIGLPADTGPVTVITNLGIYGFENGEMILESVHGGVGVTVDKARAEVGWDLKVSPKVGTTAPPTEEEMRIFQEKVDPERVWQGGRRVQR